MSRLPSEVFRTVHGSTLYGLNHPGSDHDVFIVVDGDARTKHAVRGGEDVTVVSLDRFLTLAQAGSHQSVEALFSPFKEWTVEGLRWRPFIESFRVTGHEVNTRYMRTIRAFADHPELKKRRHAARLRLNLDMLNAHGRFNPRLTDDERATVALLAGLQPGELWQILTQ